MTRFHKIYPEPPRRYDGSSFNVCEMYMRDDSGIEHRCFVRGADTHWRCADCEWTRPVNGWRVPKVKP